MAGVNPFRCSKCGARRICPECPTNDVQPWTSLANQIANELGAAGLLAVPVLDVQFVIEKILREKP